MTTTTKQIKIKDKADGETTKNRPRRSRKEIIAYNNKMLGELKQWKRKYDPDDHYGLEEIKTGLAKGEGTQWDSARGLMNGGGSERMFKLAVADKIMR